MCVCVFWPLAGTSLAAAAEKSSVPISFCNSHWAFDKHVFEQRHRQRNAAGTDGTRGWSPSQFTHCCGGVRAAAAAGAATAARMVVVISIVRQHQIAAKSAETRYTHVHTNTMRIINECARSATAGQTSCPLSHVSVFVCAFKKKNWI